VKASGTVGDRTSLTARLVLERYNMADRVPHGAALDARVRSEMRKLWAILHPVRAGGQAKPVAYVSQAGAGVAGFVNAGA